MRTDAIPKLKIRIQVGNHQSVQIQPFIQYVLSIFLQVAEQQERSLVRKMPADVLTGRVIPTPVEQLEHSADFIIPAYGKIGTASSRAVKVR